MATACTDGFIRLFNLSDSYLMATVHGVFGAPLCLEVTQNSLLLAGFEDDSFIIYVMETSGRELIGVRAVARGLGHRSFVAQIRVDFYLMEFLEKAKGEKRTKETYRIVSAGEDS